MAEIWKPIKDYEGLYEISNLGRVKSLPRNGTIKTEKILTPNMSGRYARIGLRDKIKIKYSVHRLVAEAFIPDPDNLPQVDHINGDRYDNRVENLRWVTAKENSNNPLTLKKCSIASIKKAKRGGANGNAVAVYVYDLNKKLLSTFSSAIEAATYFNVKYSRVLHNINKEQNHVNGYIFTKNKL